MKKILFLLLSTIAMYGQVPADATPLENIQITNNTTDNSATKVNVQSTDGTINTISKSDLVNVVEVNDVPSLPLVGEVGKIYVVKNVNKIYRWNGTFYQELAGSDISGKEDIANKQNSLAVDGTGTKYPTVDAVFDALANKENVANKSDSYTASSSTTYASTRAVVDGLATKANDANVVHKTGDETIAGTKTFSSFLKSGLLFINEAGGFGDVAGYTQLGGTADYFQVINGTSTKSTKFIHNGIRILTMPATNGTLALTSNLSAYQPLLTNPITGTGTTNYIPKFTASGTVGNSSIFDNGTNVGIGTNNPTTKLIIEQSNNNSSVVIRNGVTASHNAIYIGNDSVNNSSFFGSYKGDNSNFSTLILQKFGGNTILGNSTDNGVDKLQVSGTVKVLYLKTNLYTVATLPTPTGTAYATVSDALAPSYMVTVVGGGAVVTPVFYNGTNWVSH